MILNNLCTRCRQSLYLTQRKDYLVNAEKQVGKKIKKALLSSVSYPKEVFVH